MDSEKLQEIGEKLDVSAQDVEALRGKAKEEKRRRWIQKKIIGIWSGISAFLGFSLSYAYQEAELAAYPYSYEPPGGKAMPFIVFSSAAGAIGFFSSILNRKRQSLPREDMNKTIVLTIIASLLAFTMAFFFAESYMFDGGTLYNAYSKDPVEDESSSIGALPWGEHNHS